MSIIGEPPDSRGNGLSSVIGGNESRHFWDDLFGQSSYRCRNDRKSRTVSRCNDA